MKKTGYLVLTILTLSVAVGGCAADAASVNDPTTPAGESTANAPAPKEGASSAATPVSDTKVESADRGQLLGTIMASAQTTERTHVSVWATYRRDGKVTTVGFDKAGVARTELSVERIAGSSELALTAPARGSLRLREDGTTVSSTFVADTEALTSMQRDFAGSKEAAYGWISWVLTFVSCAAAGAEGGVNVIADAACVAGCIDLMNQ